MFSDGISRQNCSLLTAVSDEKESLNDNTRITIRGIRNLGNTCYFNAILQALAASRSFQVYLDELVTRASSRIPAVSTALQSCMEGSRRSADVNVGLWILFCLELRPVDGEFPKPLIPSELNMQLALRIGNFGKRKQQVLNAQIAFRCALIAIRRTPKKFYIFYWVLYKESKRPNCTRTVVCEILHRSYVEVHWRVLESFLHCPT